MDGRKYLIEYQKILKRIEFFNDQLTEIRSRTGLHSAALTGLPTGKGSETTEIVTATMVKSEVVETTLKKLVAKSKELLVEIYSRFALMDNTNEVQALQLIYLDNLTMEQAAEQMNFSIRQFSRFKQAGLKHFDDLENLAE